jgi:C1A family cysteine protease
MIERERAAATRLSAARASGEWLRSAETPTHVDLRSDGYVTAVRDQGDCGSCVAFGTVATVEGTTRLQAKDPALDVDLSEAQLFYCYAAAEGRGCSTGWWVDPALDAIRDHGLVGESVFPYVAGDQACRVDDGGPDECRTVESYTSTSAPDRMKAWLATKGPLVACFLVYEDFYAYRSGVYRHVTGAAVGGHCVSIVGFDDDADCWLAKNSWGTGWGERGFFRIAYGECGIDAEMWGVAVPSSDDGSWLTRRIVDGLWVDADSSQAAAHIQGLGWRHLPAGESRGLLVAALAAARTAHAPTDLRLVSEVIREVYVL